MRMVDIIQKKKQGLILTKEEIDFAIQGYVKNKIPDYQISALLMAICFKGMSEEETIDLTTAIINSGNIIDLSAIKGIKVDKHSTGGVGDKISLIIIPLCASVGVPIAKMSGKGLGFTGGTIDKLESIEGFNTQLTQQEFINNVNTYKMAIVGQTEGLCPADKKLYALRDVTATVDNIPLIASSVMSKKIASGADAIVLDVKVGTGAFMKTLEEATQLAELMVKIGKSLNRKTIAIISNMNEPLGYEIGNANEVKEVIEVLSGRGEVNQLKIALTIASNITILGNIYSDFNTAYYQLNKAIQSGKALDKFKQLIEIQSGNPDIIDNPNLLPQAKYHIEIESISEGYVNSINAEKIGISAMMLGAGRKTKEDIIDYSAGITLVKKVGNKVEMNDTLCILHTNIKDYIEIEKLILNAYVIKENQPGSIDYIYKIIE